MTDRDVNVNFHSALWVDGIVILVNSNFFREYLIAGDTDSLFEDVGRNLDVQIKEKYGVNEDEEDAGEDVEENVEEDENAEE